MTLLAVAVVFTSALCLFSLVLNYAVIRRLREHTDLLTKLSRKRDHDAPVDGVMHAPGTLIAPVRTRAVDGSEVEVGGPDGRTLIGFFTPHCSACTERLPDFLSFAADMPSANVVAVAIGDAEETSELAAKLAPAGKVVNEQDGGTLGKALGVQGYPAFALLESSRIVASSFELDELRVPETV